MKKFALFLLYLTSIFTIGCEHPKDNNHIEDSKTDTIAQMQVMTEAKKQMVLQGQYKTVIKTLPVEISPEHNLSPHQPVIEENPDLTVKNQDQKVLDLSVPLKTQETISSGQAANIENRGYLPDLFSEKKNKNHILNINGKLIMKEDEEVEKDSIVDGAEIDINLTE